MLVTSARRRVGLRIGDELAWTGGTMSLRSRFKRLSDLARAKGYTGHSGFCPACRERHGRTVLVTTRTGPDGQRSPILGNWPDACTACGQVPENVIEVVEVIVPSRPNPMLGRS
jgi:hypothetical protein